MPDHSAAKNKRLSPQIQLSPWTSEIVKLAQAGIEDSVMLSFIGNSGTFNLGAEQIIYLGDLRVPSQIITAMLQHDAELASGMRSVTISTVPTSEPTFWITVAPSSDASAKASTPPPSTPAPSALVNSELADIQSGASVPEINHAVSNPEPSQLEYTMTDKVEPGGQAALNQPKQAPEEMGKLYPVREPYPVELTAPIIFVQARGGLPTRW